MKWRKQILATEQKVEVRFITKIWRSWFYSLTAQLYIPLQLQLHQRCDSGNETSGDVLKTQREMPAGARSHTETHTCGKCENNKMLKHTDDGAGKGPLACKQPAADDGRCCLIYFPTRGSQRNPIGNNLAAQQHKAGSEQQSLNETNEQPGSWLQATSLASPSTKQQALSGNLKRWNKGAEWKSALFLFLKVTSGQECLAVSPPYHPFFSSCSHVKRVLWLFMR